jgi:hypothetical protein
VDSVESVPLGATPPIPASPEGVSARRGYSRVEYMSSICALRCAAREPLVQSMLCILHMYAVHVARRSLLLGRSRTSLRGAVFASEGRAAEGARRRKTGISP